MKKIPMRTCVVTKEKLPKNELIRIVNSNGSIIVDESGKVNGHGCYLKKNIEVVRIAKNKKVLDRVLETTISDEVYDEIIEKIK